ncbi:MAG: S1C family serine protease [Ilumatobacteraceae bacterium]
MDRSEGNDDEQYPSAPVPAHERQWRHPSEVGQQTWVATEPPLTIGRGLSAATGVIGGVLALAVLWTMLPTHAGRSAGVTVRSTVATSAALGNTSTVPASVSPAPDTTSDASPTTTTDPASTTSAPNAIPTTVDETPTTRPEPLPTYAVTLGTSVEPVAVAVAVNHGALVITTASAVRDDNTVALRLPDGSVETAEVLLVDERSGFAVLAHDASTSMASFTVATDVQPGEQLSFYGGDSATAIVGDDGAISVAPPSTEPGTDTTVADTPIDELPEGTPVVNERGELVALCSHRDGVASLVSLEHLDSLRKALANDAAGRVWMGVMLREAGVDGTGVTVDSVTTGGPAAEGGLLPGDVITSLDDQAVVDATSIGAALAPYEPGDAITLAIIRDGRQLTIGVTLAAPRANL